MSTTDNRSAEMELQQIKILRDDAMDKIREAEKAAYAWFCACPIGDERIRASDIYDNVRNSTRVG